MSCIDEHGTKRELFEVWKNRRVLAAFVRHMGCPFCREQVAALQAVAGILIKRDITPVVITIGRYSDIPRFKSEFTSSSSSSLASSGSNCSSFLGEVYVDSDLQEPKCFQHMQLLNGPQYLFDMDDQQQQQQNLQEGGFANPSFRSDTVAAHNRAVAAGFTTGGYPADGGEPAAPAAYPALTPNPHEHPDYTGDVLQLGGVFVLGPGNVCDFTHRSEYVGDVADIDAALAAAVGDSGSQQSSSEPQSRAGTPTPGGAAADGGGDGLRQTPPGSPTRSSESSPAGSGATDRGRGNASASKYVYPLTQAWNERLQTTQTRPPDASDVVEATSPPPVPTKPPHSMDYSAILVAVAVILLSGVSAVFLPQLNNIANESRMVAACCAIVVLALVGLETWAIKAWFFPTPAQDAVSTNKKCPLGANSDGTTPGNGLEAVPPAAGGVVLRPISEVDRLIMEAGAPIACNCSFMQNIDMLSVSDGKGGKRSRGRTESDAVSTAKSGTGGDMGSETTSPGVEGEEEDVASLTALQSTLCYIREFLAKPNPHLGRKGPTCPFVPSSLKYDSIYVGVVSAAQASSVNQLEPMVMDLMTRFKKLQPTEGPRVPYKAIVLVFPELPLASAPELIDALQKRLKPDFVAEGMMLGEFHLNNNAPGLRNPHFYPLRTPYPSLAMRYMVPSDIAFLNPADFSVPVRRSMLQSFIDRFGGDKQVEVAKELLVKLGQEEGREDR